MIRSLGKLAAIGGALLCVISLSGCSASPEDQATALISKVGDAYQGKSAQGSHDAVSALMCKGSTITSVAGGWGSVTVDKFAVRGATATKAPAGAPPGSYYAVSYLYADSNSAGPEMKMSIVRVGPSGDPCIFSL